MEVDEMPDREELMYLVAQALSKSREADDFQEAADYGRGPRWGAAAAHRRATDVLERVVCRLQVLSDSHKAQV